MHWMKTTVNCCCCCELNVVAIFVGPFCLHIYLMLAVSLFHRMWISLRVWQWWRRRRRQQYQHRHYNSIVYFMQQKTKRLKWNDRDSSHCHWRLNLFYNYIQTSTLAWLSFSWNQQSLAHIHTHTHNWQAISRLNGSMTYRRNKHIFNHTIKLVTHIRANKVFQRL